MFYQAFRYLKDFFGLLYPDICCGCGNHLFEGESLICTSCRLRLPYTNEYLISPNKTEKVFFGRVKIEGAASYLDFKKGGYVQNILHALKYKDRQDLGVLLGNMFGEQLKLSEKVSKADLIIPIPLHINKFRIRGYNQAALIAEGISNSMNIPFEENILIRAKHTETQTKKNRYERFKNVSEVFEVLRKEEIKDKHIMLIDDVITTGSTLEAGAINLLDAGAGKISVACIANA